jgi:hypothetical protein
MIAPSTIAAIRDTATATGRDAARDLVMECGADPIALAAIDDVRATRVIQVSPSRDIDDILYQVDEYHAGMRLYTTAAIEALREEARRIASSPRPS